MNFFQRRNILKGANYLELTPLVRYDFERKDEKTIYINVPRFENDFLRKLFTGPRKSEFVKFHLDELGSRTYLLIDGEKNVGRICDELNAASNGELKDCETRVTKFLTQLYLDKFITFQELMKG